MRVPIALAVVLTLLLSACGSEQSLSEYAGQVEVLVTTMNARIDELDDELEESQDLETVQWYATERVAARTTFLEGLGTLDPPDEVAELHSSARDIMGRLTAAESALADRALSLETTEGIDLWETPEGIAARAADEEAIALCQAAEAELDTRDERDALEGVPWIPPEMREVVQVAFGCREEDR